MTAKKNVEEPNLKANSELVDTPDTGNWKPGIQITDAAQKPLQAEQQTSNPVEEERKKKLDELNTAMLKFNMYPVAADEKTKNEALSTIRKIYTNDQQMRQIILFLLHETLLQFSEYRIPKNLEHIRKKMPQADPVQQRMQVYRSMFNYSSSLEGLNELVELLAEFGDDDSAKVLTHYFSFLCAFDGSEASHMMRNSVVEALGKTKSIYGLKALLSYLDIVESEQLSSRMINAIVKWKDKLGKMKLEPKEKALIMEKINKVMMFEHQEGHYR